jgi:flagellar protein FlaF
MTVGQADTPAKLIYLALQFMYLAKKPNDNYALYIGLARETLRAAPSTKSLIDRVNNHILSGDLYKALREARKLIAYEKDHRQARLGVKATTKSGVEAISPREFEAALLLKAAAKLQAIQASWTGKKPRGLDDALLYNRRLWMVFIDAVTRDGNKLPKQVRENIALLGIRVLSDTVCLMTRSEPAQLTALIEINRGIAAGLRGRK